MSYLFKFVKVTEGEIIFERSTRLLLRLGDGHHRRVYKTLTFSSAKRLASFYPRHVWPHKIGKGSWCFTYWCDQRNAEVW
jgi:hypothetical protein